MKNRISGVILAGGTNKRFGGKTIISRMISTISDLFDEIIIVTNNPIEFKDLTQYKIVQDLFLKAGPLGGIHAALKASSEDAIFVFAGDMPFLDKEIISDQINEFNKRGHDVFIPKVDQFVEPLHAIYRKTVLNDLEKFLSERKNRAARDFLSKLNVGYLLIPKSEKTEIAFSNINSPSDLAKISI